jgi:hypothetical protein
MEYKNPYFLIVPNGTPQFQIREFRKLRLKVFVKKLPARFTPYMD